MKNTYLTINTSNEVLWQARKKNNVFKVNKRQNLDLDICKEKRRQIGYENNKFPKEWFILTSKHKKGS